VKLYLHEEEEEEEEAKKKKKKKKRKPNSKRDGKFCLSFTLEFAGSSHTVIRQTRRCAKLEFMLVAGDG